MRVGIAHRDSRFRARIAEILTQEYEAQCEFSVADAPACERLTRHHLPDILLLDMGLPGGRISELTRSLVNETHCIVLLLDSAGSKDVSVIFECLGHGATDVARLPRDVQAADSTVWNDFRNRFGTLLRLTGHGVAAEGRWAAGMPVQTKEQAAPALVVLGSSTGGPRALATVLASFQSSTQAAIVIVQHLDAHFYPELADWLSVGCALPVIAVTEPMLLESGRVYLAARPEHLVMTQDFRLAFSHDWKDLICRPSIDVFFRSVAAVPGARGAGALLTGMGRDGAEGLLALRNAGFYTIAQAAATSVIYGMPKAAAELGAAKLVLSIEEIGAGLLRGISGVAR